jgi:hypothetical protein
MAQYRVPSGVDPIDFLLRENANLANRVQALEGRRLSTWDRYYHTTVAAPVEGQHHVQASDDSVRFYSNTTWRRLPNVVYHIKVFADAQTLSAGDGKFIFSCTEDMDELNLIDAQAYVTTVSSSGTPTIQIRNVTDAVDMLSTRITIDVNEKSSTTAAAQRVINTATDDVATADEIAIDVDTAGTGAKGLGVMLTFGLS